MQSTRRGSFSEQIIKQGVFPIQHEDQEYDAVTDQNEKQQIGYAHLPVSIEKTVDFTVERGHLNHFRSSLVPVYPIRGFFSRTNVRRREKESPKAEIRRGDAALKIRVLILPAKICNKSGIIHKTVIKRACNLSGILV